MGVKSRKTQARKNARVETTHFSSNNCKEMGDWGWGGGLN
jgi:hypothetical protein